MCSGYKCSRSSLILLNVFYMFVAVVLIGVGAYAEGSGVVKSVAIAGGIVAVGVFLLLVSILGIIGAAKHQQVLLFFYMIVMFLVFILQFCIAIGCLAVNMEQRKAILKTGWDESSRDVIATVEEQFHCTGFESNVTSAVEQTTSSPGCYSKLEAQISDALRVVGLVGLFFSFTEIFGIALARMIRNEKPQYKPDQFM